MRHAGAAVLLGTAFLAAPGLAAPPVLDLPVDCTLGATCFIEDYTDTDPGAGAHDYTCGLKTRDGHRGTDIALLSFEAMTDGVAVLSAAPGRVAAVRDDMPDVPVTPVTRDGIEGRECGNGIRIDHGDGWQTLYCHMKQGSVAVATGARVQAGERLGEVGLSGLTNAPHLHFGVLRDGKVVDPFLPDPGATCGGTRDDGLWRQAPAYARAGLFTAGFATALPDLAAVQSGAARVSRAPPEAALVLYSHVFHAEPGDRLDFTARGPDGTIFADTVTLDAPQARLFRAVGRKSPPSGWPVGAFRGYVTLRRGARILAVRHADIAIAE